MKKTINLPRDLPSVETFSQSGLLATLRARYGGVLVTESARSVIDEIRKAMVREVEGDGLTLEGLAALVIKRVESLLHGGLTEVINATGTVLHTNLGRSPLCKEALEKALLAG
ncbi:MAG: hypothetical protein ACE5DR_05495, partial [Thermodesulfobacteriota bacterium]